LETAAVELPETRYALSGDVSIAYQVHGDGPIDLVVVPPFVTNVELMWEDENSAAYYRRLGEVACVIRFDKRSTGLSDRAVGIADMETRMDDVRAVMDAVGIERAAIMGLSEGGPLAALFAATYPERTIGLLLWGSAPRFVRAPGFPWAQTREEFMAELDDLVSRWGTTELAAEHVGGLGLGPDAAESHARWMRSCASPGAVRQLEADEPRDRRPRRRSVHPGADARHAPHRRCERARRGRPLDGGAHPDGSLRRVRGLGSRNRLG
jgi:pimeloyl-ACP methyl ester carboxylesterase